MMNTRTVVIIIIVGLGIIGSILIMELSRATSNDVIQLSATAEASPNNVKIHTLQQLSSVDSGVIILDNSSLDKIPALKNAIDQAFDKYVPPPFHDSHTFSTMISQGDEDSILNLAGNMIEQLPETQTSDQNFGVNFTTYKSSVEFKFNTLYYHVVLEKMVLSQDNQSNNIP